MYELKIDGNTQLVFSENSGCRRIKRPKDSFRSVEHVVCLKRLIGFVDVRDRRYYLDQKLQDLALLTGEEGLILSGTAVPLL